MLDTDRINLLFNNVLNSDIFTYNIPIKAIKNGIETMQAVYKKETTSLCSLMLHLADYNDPAHRCAYLHKYAALHTAMVRDMMYSAVQMNFQLFYEIVFSSNPFTICSLGGGPGTDVIGVLAALHQSFSYFPTSVTIVDYMTSWSMSFTSILRELGSGLYGAFGNNVYHFLNWSYLGDDLLQKTWVPEVLDALCNSALVTMIKFASAAACVDTSKMIQNIFTAMKPGAILLFIDNDAGGFHELIMNGARENNFISILGPIRHEKYYNDAVRIKRFGYVSCHQTTITVHILQKPVYPDNFDYYANTIVPSGPVLLERTEFLERPLANYNVPIHQTSYFPTMPPYNPQIRPDQLLGRLDYTTDEVCNNLMPPFIEIPQTTTHSMLPKSIKKAKLSCLPLNKRKRNKLAKKNNIVKSRTNKLRRRKKKVKKSNSTS